MKGKCLCCLNACKKKVSEKKKFAYFSAQCSEQDNKKMTQVFLSQNKCQKNTKKIFLVIFDWQLLVSHCCVMLLGDFYSTNF